MSQHYVFHEPGSVPGIPGLFSGVQVVVEENGTYTVLPLPYHPHAELVSVPEEAPPEEEKSQAQAVPIESEGA